MTIATLKTLLRLGTFALAVLGPAIAAAAPVDGFTEPYRKIDVAAAETGTVARLLIHEGDAVKKGQALAVLDNDVLEVTREIAEANIHAQGKRDSARAEAELRRTRFQRLEPLLAEGHASQEEIDRARTDLAVAEANLRAAEEQHLLDQLEQKKIEAMIERRTVRSPIDGIVTKLYKDEREFVSSNAAAVLTVVQLDPLRATFSIPTVYAPALTAGQAVTVTFPDSESKVRGRVEFVAPITEAESGTVRVKVLVENARGEHRCGVRCLLDLDEVSHNKGLKPLTAGSAQP